MFQLTTADEKLGSNDNNNNNNDESFPVPSRINAFKAVSM